MKIASALWLVTVILCLACGPVATQAAEADNPIVGYVSIGGKKKIAVYGMNRDTGELTVRETTVQRSDMRDADEVFLTGTTWLVLGVVEIDSRPVGNGKVGPVTQKLYEHLMMEIRSATGGQEKQPAS